MQFNASAAYRTFCAPGRINLIGEHTDYNGGFAMPSAIGLATRVSMSTREDRCISVRAENFSETVNFEIDAIGGNARGQWSDYIRGVALQLEAAGYRLSGADLIVRSDVPIGAGLSSSAALEVATALALLARTESRIDKRELALLCQRAENEFVGVRSGIMDQLAACMGRSGYAMLLDCRSLDIEYVPIPENLRMVVCNSMVKHALASGEYNRRRQECEAAVERLSTFLPDVRQLRDVTPLELDEFKAELDPVIFRRALHVVRENQRTLEAADALRHNHLDTLGKLLIASHESLRDDYEVSCLELDLLVEIAVTKPGVHGSRMTGGGFGGCTISIVDQSCVDTFVKQIAEDYARRTGIRCQTYVCEAAAGAREETADR